MTEQLELFEQPVKEKIPEKPKFKLSNKRILIAVTSKPIREKLKNQFDEIIEVSYPNITPDYIQIDMYFIVKNYVDIIGNIIKTTKREYKGEDLNFYLLIDIKNMLFYTEFLLGFKSFIYENFYEVLIPTNFMLSDFYYYKMWGNV
jgi:hypothetical protein